MPLTYFTIGPKTEELAEAYLAEVKEHPEKAGARLRAFLNTETMMDWFEKDLKDITVKQLISTLMSTKPPTFHVESDRSGLLEVDWTPTELKILSNVSLHCLDSEAYNNGLIDHREDYPIPRHEHIVFVSGAILTSSSKPGASYDTQELIVEGVLDSEALFMHYEEKLMPVLLALNKAAIERGENLVVNLPDFSTEVSSGPYQTQIEHALPDVLQKIIEKNIGKLTNIHTIRYAHNQSVKDETLERSVKIDAGEGRNLCFEIKPAEFAPLDFPASITAEQIKAQNLVLAKIVASSPVSWPGNDVWDDELLSEESQIFVSVNALSKMLAAGTLVIKKTEPEYQVKYNPAMGVEQFCQQHLGSDVFFNHSEMRKTLGMRFVGHSYNIMTIDYAKAPMQQSSNIHSFWGVATSIPSTDEAQDSLKPPEKS